MKFTITCVLLITLFMTIVATEPIQLQSAPGILIPAQALRFTRAAYSGGSNTGSSYSAPKATSAYEAPASSAYGSPAQIPSPPCPKNYLFGCQPSLTPVPCSAPTASYSAPAALSSPPPASQGSYSHYYPQYAVPQYQAPQYSVPIVRELY